MAEEQLPIFQSNPTEPLVSGQYYVINYLPQQCQSDQISESVPQLLDFSDIFAANGLQPRFDYMFNLDVSAANEDLISRAQFFEPYVNYENFADSLPKDALKDSSNAELKFPNDCKNNFNAGQSQNRTDSYVVMTKANKTKNSNKKTTKRISTKSNKNNEGKDHVIETALKKEPASTKATQTCTISYAQAAQNNNNCKNIMK